MTRVWSQSKNAQSWAKSGLKQPKVHGRQGRQSENAGNRDFWGHGIFEVSLCQVENFVAVSLSLVPGFISFRMSPSQRHSLAMICRMQVRAQPELLDVILLQQENLKTHSLLRKNLNRPL